VQALSRTTLAGQAYDAVRAAILDGRLAPGRKVVVRPLAEALGLSATPIKAALAALEREGFLVAIPHRGYFVPEVDAADLREIYELREVIDGIAARDAAGKSDPQEFLARLAHLLEEQRTCVDRGDLSGYSDLDVLFHMAIWERAGNRRLVQVAGNLLGQVRFGSGSSARIAGRLPLALSEHASILAALSAGDPVLAERHTRSHVRLAGEALNQFLLDHASSSRGDRGRRA